MAPNNAVVGRFVSGSVQVAGFPGTCYVDYAGGAGGHDVVLSYRAPGTVIMIR